MDKQYDLNNCQSLFGYAKDLAQRIHEANTVTACHFCNSTTSRTLTPKMTDLIQETKGGSDEVVNAIKEECKKIQKRKRAGVQWKLRSIREAFEKEIEPGLAKR